MKAWTVLAVAHDGEMVCPDCYTPEERSFARDEEDLECDDMSVVFASDEIDDNDVCGRCGEPILA